MQKDGSFMLASSRMIPYAPERSALMLAGEQFKGAAVIVTVPIGCLKAHDIDFRPPLPAWKLEAIDKMGNGNLNKARL